MNIRQLTVGLMLCVLFCSCSPETHGRSSKTRNNETAYFRRVEIRTDPVRVFDEIQKEQVLDGSEGRYFEVTFDSRGLVEKIRLKSGTNCIWEASYEFCDTKRISSETWIEAGMNRKRFISATGAVTNEVRKRIDGR